MIDFFLLICALFLNSKGIVGFRLAKRKGRFKTCADQSEGTSCPFISLTAVLSTLASALAVR